MWEPYNSAWCCACLLRLWTELLPPLTLISKEALRHRKPVPVAFVVQGLRCLGVRNFKRQVCCWQIWLWRVFSMGTLVEGIYKFKNFIPWCSPLCSSHRWFASPSSLLERFLPKDLLETSSADLYTIYIAGGGELNSPFSPATFYI